MTGAKGMTGYRTVALTVSTALFMQFLDSTTLNTAIPTIARDFGVPAIDLNLAIISYQLSMTVLIPLGTALAERIGQRNAFVLSLFVFMTGSILSAMSTSLPTLIGARMVQGASSAVMVPVSRLLVVRSVDKGELLNAMNWLLIPSIIGPMMGPALAGQIVTYASWPWIFLVNVPVALLGIVMSLIVVPDIRDEVRGPVDTKGMMLIAPAIFALMFGLENAVNPMVWWLSPILLAAGALLLWLFVRHTASSPAPVLDLSLLRITSFRQSVLLGLIFRTAALATGFLMPLWLQLGMGMSAAKAGAILVVSALGTVVSRLVGVRLTEIVHPRSVALGGAVALVFALLVTSRLEAAWPLAAFYCVLAFQAIAMSLAMMVVSALAYVEIEPNQMGSAAGLFTTFQQITMALGVMLGVWTMSIMRFVYHTTETDSRIYSASYLILAAFAAVGAVVMRRLDPEATGALQRARN